MRRNGYKPILVSHENHHRLAQIGNKTQTFDQIISGLLNTKVDVNKTLGLQGEWIETPIPVAPESKGEQVANG